MISVEKRKYRSAVMMSQRRVLPSEFSITSVVLKNSLSFSLLVLTAIFQVNLGYPVFSETTNYLRIWSRQTL